MNIGTKIILTILLSIPLTAMAGPFGLYEGMTLKDLKKITELQKINQYIYYTDKLPNGHPSFENYILSIHPEKGLCSISAISNHMEINKAKNEFFKIRELLISKYGKGQDYQNDFDDRYTKSNNEIQLLNDRIIRPSITWINHPLYHNLPKNIFMIRLSINPTEDESQKTFLGLDYQLEKECLLKQENNSNKDNSML